MRKRKQCKPIDSSDAETELALRSVKISLNSITKPQYQQIMTEIMYEKCMTASEISYQASLLFLYEVNKNFDESNIKFFTQKCENVIRKAFDSVSQTGIRVTKATKLYEMPAEFVEMLRRFGKYDVHSSCGSVGRPMPSRFQLTQAVTYNYELYATNVENNIMMWWYSRVQRFIRMICFKWNKTESVTPYDDIDIRNIMKNLAYNYDYTDGDPARQAKMDELYSEIRNRCGPSFEDYHTFPDYIEHQLLESMIFFINIQREIEQYNIDNQELVDAWLRHKSSPAKFEKPCLPMPPKIKKFVVVPFCDVKLRHIRFDHQDMIHLLRQLYNDGKLLANDANQVQLREYYEEESHMIEAWEMLFNMETIDSLKKRDQSFHCQLVTDSVSASVVFESPQRQNAGLTKQKMVEMYQTSRYEIAIDPGRKTYLAGVRVDLQNGDEVSEFKNVFELKSIYVYSCDCFSFVWYRKILRYRQRHITGKPEKAAEIIHENA